MFRFLASVFQTNNASMTAGSFAILIVLVFSGFIITQSSMPVWLKWGFWVSPITYGEMGLSLNEFLAPRWQKMLTTNTTIGQEILESRGLNFDGYLYWISLSALFGFIIVFNIGYVLALTFLKSPGSSRAVISHEKLSQIQGSEDSRDGSCLEKKSGNSPAQSSIEPNKGRMVLPFTPLTVVFQDVQYYVDIPLEMREKGFTNKKLQILSDITVEESVIFSAWLRLSPQIDSKTKAEFVNEVLETIELDGIKDALVGIPGINGLSNEQRKRLTIAVELVANPSIIFMVEPTTGLDTRAVAIIVMRAVKNVAGTGRTVEAFDESLNGMLTSQYGDINKKIVVFGETKTVVAFLEDYFGFHHDQLAIVAVVLIAFPLVFASLFSYFIGQLKFQRR
ncbi:hypothetical protein CMV_023068 [Castanea mollissima]|uniref:ABC transporter domain-containing protein n=1 Tax=Castanea mollissima TaxID=60419 RepID=A0A8J4QTY5_9ROSI|nr:hypothetical protein CMV_023068 [Castanea mollissima]